MLNLNDSITTLPGIGEKKGLKFQKLNIFTIEDFLNYFPRKYEDRTVKINLDMIKDGEATSGEGKIIRFQKSYLRNRKTLIKILLSNDEGYFFIKFFNNPYILTQLEIDRKVYFYGKANINHFDIDFINPEIEFDKPSIKTNSIYPIYPLTKGINNNEIIKQIDYIIKNYNIKSLEYLDDELREKFNLMGIPESIVNVHLPENLENLKQARFRCIFDEFFNYCVYLQFQRNKRLEEKGISFAKKDEVKEKIQNLPFRLTNSQKKSLDEILNDMGKNTVMKRLLQGDVGSGKTVIALLTAYNAVLNGYQVAFMVPTEILATQHYNTAINFFENENINITLLVSATKKKNAIYKKISNGDLDVIIGTHALIAEKVSFNNLGYVITDEQHRFGVLQRETLSKKSHYNPDTLVMTATPIPRTLSLILHNDMDISTINELPSGRKKIKTFGYKKSQAKSAYEKVKVEIDKGRQAFIVCPLIEESEKLDLISAKELYKELSNGYLKDYRLALIHGGLKNSDKDRIMRDFEKNNINVLISTTVIEVGINVPNATVLVINDAQRFGLSQLHQLRGRVGRGEYQSYCILLHDAKTNVANERIKTFIQIDDGFEIAKKDLELRGAGEIFGTKQSGQINFKIGDISQNTNILFFAKECTDYVFKDIERNKVMLNKITESMYKNIFIS